MHLTAVGLWKFLLYNPQQVRPTTDGDEHAFVLDKNFSELT